MSGICCSVMQRRVSIGLRFDEVNMFGISVLWKHAGLLSLWYGEWSLHIGVRRGNWIWGYEEVPASIYDGFDFGLGPIFLVCGPL